ncbi:MAG: hypothetical protein ACI4S2_15195 [Lachnospiraceae bacterium]
MKKRILSFLTIFILLHFAYFSVLCLSEKISTPRMECNVEKSAYVLEKEGLYPMKVWFNPYIAKWDNYTTAISYGIIYCVDNDNAVISSVLNVFPDGGENPIESFSKEVSGTNEAYGEYTRYWCGSLVFLRLASLLLDLDGIRYFLLILYVLAISKCLILIYKRLSLIDAACFFFFNVLSFFGINVMCPTYSQEIYIILGTIIAMCIAFKKKEDFVVKEFLFWYIVGSITMYLTWLSYPLTTFGVPICLYILLKNSYFNKIGDSILTIIRAGIGYGAGYLSTMMVKGVMNRIFGLEDTAGSRIVTLIGQQSFRERIEVIITNLYRYNSGFFKIGFISSILLILVYAFFRHRITFHIQLEVILPLFLIALLPMAWWFVVAEHASGHGIEAEVFIISVYAALNIFRMIFVKR